MNNNLNILMAQINPTVGALTANREKIIEVIQNNQANHDVIVFPELVLTGYPPEDLLYRREFQQATTDNLKQIQNVVQDCFVIIGHPHFDTGCCYNSVSIFHQGNRINQYHKQHLPNYDIFDEARYFTPGPKKPCTLQIKNYKLGICICEDAWQAGPVDDLIEQNISVLISVNASPFDQSKYQQRLDLFTSYAKRGLSIIYVNQIGGQDELLFDGQSLAINSEGTLIARSPAFKEDLNSITINGSQLSGKIAPQPGPEQLLYEALVCGTKDYVNKNHFPGVLLGLSGGIDSALTLAIAVDALGAEKVHAVLMPSRYSATMSYEDAISQVNCLAVSYSTLSIEPTFKALTDTLEPMFCGLAPDTTEENIQARIRGILLMAISNKTGKMVLTTSNKSETAVGYATLYGDMAGGFAVLKDVLKTQVYALAHYRNTCSAIIPQRVITRPPSAELRANQTDQDSLPDYATLDAIISAYMEHHLTPTEIVEQGFSPEVVNQIISLIRRNEYKRRQSAPGIKISRIAFGKDWRYPITNGFNS